MTKILRKLRTLLPSILLALLVPTLAWAVDLAFKQGHALLLDGDTPDSNTYAQLILGYDGTNLQFIKTDSGGALTLSSSTAALVDTELPAAAALSDTTANPTAPMVGAAMMGFNSTWQRIGTLTPQDDRSNGIIPLETLSYLALFDGTTWDRARSYAANADNVTSPTLGLLGVADYLFAYDGTNWDRARIDGSGNLLVSLGTGLDATNDKVGGNIVSNAAFTDGTSTVFMMGGYFDDAAGTALTENDGFAMRINQFGASVGVVEDGDTRALYQDVETVGADDVANTENGAWGYNALMGFDGTTWDRFRTSATMTGGFLSALRAEADLSGNTAAAGYQLRSGTPTNDMNTANFLGTIAWPIVYDPVDTSNEDYVFGARTNVDDLAVTTEANTIQVSSTLWGLDIASSDWDRIRSFNWADTITPGDGTDDGLLGTYSILTSYNGSTQDRLKTSQIAGFYTPSATTINVTVDGGEDCTADNALTAGVDYIVQASGTVFLELNADAATAGATTADMRIENPGLYTVRATAAQDTACFSVASGSAVAYITAVTWN